jgi:hypothetical protein
MAPHLRIGHMGNQSEWSAGPIRIGRASDNDIVLDDESLSRHHAEIRWGRAGWTIHDLDSANGTWSHGVRLPQHRLRAGTPITLGAVPMDVLALRNQSPFKLSGRTLMLAGVLVGAAFLTLQKPDGHEPSTEPPAAKVFEARLPPPPDGLTAERAFQGAKKFYGEAGQQGSRLAEARRAAQWSRQLYKGSPSAELDELQENIEQALQERYHRGVAAFLQARRMGKTVEAEAAMRLLREAFPPDDPRSFEIDRMEKRR